MKANELRIGNHIIYEGVECQFTPRMLFGMHNTEVLSVEQFDDRVKPIPLTNEEFLKLGYQLDSKHKEDGYPSLITKIESIRIYMQRDGRFYFTPNEHENKVYIDFVHTFQNLYFALTRKELTYEL